MLRKLFVFLFVTLSFALHAAPQVTSISPFEGSEAGGTVVTITGSGFTAATGVNFGQTQVVPVVINDSTITAVAPTSVPGAVNITVTDGIDTSPIVRADIFTFTGVSYECVTHGTSPGVLSKYTIPANSFVSDSFVGFFPNDVAITRDGRIAVVTGGGDGSVSFVDLSTNTFINSVTIPGANTVNVVISPDDRFAYVTDSANDQILTIDLVTFSQVAPTFVAGAPVGPLALSADGTALYMASTTSDQVLAFDTTSGNLVATITGISTPNALALLPNNQTLYVTSFIDGAAYMIDVASATLNPTPIPVGSTPIDIAITSNGQFGYVLLSPGQIAKIDIATSTSTITPADLSKNTLLALTLTQDNSTAYALTISSFIAVNLTDFTTQTVSVPSSLAEAITPDQAPVARFSTQVNGATVLFNATDSDSPVGTVASYAWNFGDGNTLVTSSPTTSHTYTTSGTFTVTLTVTNSQGTAISKVYTGQMISHNGSDFAQVSKSVSVTAAPSKLSAPKVFLGNVVKHDGKLSLQFTWQKVPGAVSYQIFGHNKLVAQIQAIEVNFFTRRIHPKHYYKEHIHKLEKRLEKQYKIRAVDGVGNTSAFTPLSFEI